MRRRLFNFASVVPLLLCAAAIILWAYSWPHPITLFFTHEHQQSRAWLNAGRAGIDNQPQVVFETAQRERDLNVMRVLGGRDLMAAPPSHLTAKWSRSSALLFPVIAIVLVGIVIVPAALKRASRNARAAARRCIACCYNLTGNISGICPECGSLVALMHEGQHA